MHVGTLGSNHGCGMQLRPSKVTRVLPSTARKMGVRQEWAELNQVSIRATTFEQIPGSFSKSEMPRKSRSNPKGPSKRDQNGSTMRRAVAAQVRKLRCPKGIKPSSNIMQSTLVFVFCQHSEQ
jgi:hypothetical protein